MRLLEAYPDAKFLWSHRDPAKVLGSVCSLIHYTRSWSSDRDDSLELGPEQLERWWTAVSRAMEFRGRVGDERFADLSFADLQVDPVGALGAALRADRDRVPRHLPRRGGRVGGLARARVARPAHATTWRDFGLEADQVRRAFRAVHGVVRCRDVTSDTLAWRGA